ncbi:hypothetical protein KR038_003595 [Drosophila bunnanda]|nr:hypothetical protein KR038_003595 [Drosophila bunnanda]
MELLSRLLLITGLLMLSWHWAASFPRSQPVATTPAVIHPENPKTTPDFNTTDVFVQSIFEINPSCKPGWILAGNRCRKEA